MCYNDWHITTVDVLQQWMCYNSQCVIMKDTVQQQMCYNSTDMLHHPPFTTVHNAKKLQKDSQYIMNLIKQVS